MVEEWVERTPRSDSGTIALELDRDQNKAAADEYRSQNLNKFRSISVPISEVVQLRVRDIPLDLP